MDESSPYFRPRETAGANGNCGKSPKKTDKRMKVKYLKIRFAGSGLAFGASTCGEGSDTRAWWFAPVVETACVLSPSYE
ncbi:MAG: hypothetical protein WBZ11_06440 [Candidatus Sulfotelmatobacter sp.]